MGQSRRLSFILIGIGAVVLLASLFADPLGIGGYPGIGFKQVIGMIVGVVVGIVGLVLRRK